MRRTGHTLLLSLLLLLLLSHAHTPPGTPEEVNIDINTLKSDSFSVPFLLSNFRPKNPQFVREGMKNSWFTSRSEFYRACLEVLGLVFDFWFLVFSRNVSVLSFLPLEGFLSDPEGFHAFPSEEKTLSPTNRTYLPTGTHPSKPFNEECTGHWALGTELCTARVERQRERERSEVPSELEDFPAVH